MYMSIAIKQLVVLAELIYHHHAVQLAIVTHDQLTYVDNSTIAFPLALLCTRILSMWPSNKFAACMILVSRHLGQ